MFIRIFFVFYILSLFNTFSICNTIDKKGLIHAVQPKIISMETDDVLNFVKHFLPQNPVIIEAGAFDGTDTLKMKKTWPKAIIHSFEPDPNAYEILRKKIQGIDNIKIYNVALSNNNGISSFYPSSVNASVFGSGSLLMPKEHLKITPVIKFGKPIKVNTITLNSWASKHNIYHVDMMWLDMQGYELLALQHGKSVLKNVKLIYTEVEFKELYKGQPLYHHVKRWLEQQGFTLIAKDFIDTNVWFGHGNAVFIRK